MRRVRLLHYFVAIHVPLPWKAPREYYSREEKVTISDTSSREGESTPMTRRSPVESNDVLSSRQPAEPSVTSPSEEPAWKQRAVERSIKTAKLRAAQRVQRFLAWGSSWPIDSWVIPDRPPPGISDPNSPGDTVVDLIGWACRLITRVSETREYVFERSYHW